MDPIKRIEQGLRAAIKGAGGAGAPPGLAAALRYSVFPGGARVRPRLCLAVARACGADDPALAEAGAIAIELLHCASLIHDDLPCFDDAPIRRGKASVHRAFGERLAVLAGDALIVLAFEALARGSAASPLRLPPLVVALSQATGSPRGLCAGQAWECERRVVLADYHQAKTGALFAAATSMGAGAAGRDPELWRALGERLGEAYQVADDIRDVASEASELGKPVGRDAALGRPSAAVQLGVEGAMRRLELLVAGAIESIPDCPGAAELRDLILLEVQRLLPAELARQVA